MANKPFELDASGRLVKIDPVQDIITGKSREKETPKIETVGPPEPTNLADTKMTQEVAPEPVSGQIKPVEPVVINKQNLLNNVQSTFDKYGGTAGANEAFIQGVAKLSKGRAATPEELSAGGTIADVVNRFGVGEQLNGFGIAKPEVKAAETTVGATPEVKAVAEEATPATRSAATQIQDLLAGIPAGIQTAEQKAMAEQRIQEKQKAVTDIQLEVSNARTAIANQLLLDDKELLAMEGQGRGIPMGLIQAKQANLSREQKLDLMISQNNYNNLLVQESILSDDLAKAQSIVQSTADTYLENSKYQLDALVQQGKIEQDQADRLTQQATFERDLALKGYVPLTQSQATEFKDNELFTDPVTGKIYKKPEVTMSIAEMVDIEKTKAEIEKIYNDIDTGAGIDALDYQKKLLEIRALEQTATNKQAEIDKAKIQEGLASEVINDKINFIDELINHSGMNSSVGITKAGRIPILDFISGKKSDFVAGINQLVSQETMDTLTALKAKGGTLGALSDQERIMLQNAATKFGSWAVKDKNGNVVGYNTTENNVKEELNKIKTQTEKLLKESKKTATTESIGAESTPGGEYSW